MSDSMNVNNFCGESYFNLLQTIEHNVPLKYRTVLKKLAYLELLTHETDIINWKL